MREEYYNGYNHKDSLYLCYCGYENCPPNHNCLPHFRDCYLIHYVISGTCYIHINNTTHIAKSGDYFIIPPNKLVSYNGDEKPLSYYWFGFGGKEADRFYKEILNKQVIIKALHKEETVQLIKSSIKELKNSFVNQFRLRGNLYHLLSLFEQPTIDDTDLEKKNDLLIEQALSYIHHNYMSTTGLTVHEIAEYLGIERTSFSKIFKRKVGLTAIEYIGNCQIDKALELIRTTGISFTEISNVCGICDPYYFTKLIKKRTGMTPSQYRKKHQASQLKG